MQKCLWQNLTLLHNKIPGETRDIGTYLNIRRKFTASPQSASTELERSSKQFYQNQEQDKVVGVGELVHSRQMLVSAPNPTPGIALIMGTPEPASRHLKFKMKWYSHENKFPQVHFNWCSSFVGNKMFQHLTLLLAKPLVSPVLFQFRNYIVCIFW